MFPVWNHFSKMIIFGHSKKNFKKFKKTSSMVASWLFNALIPHCQSLLLKNIENTKVCSIFSLKTCLVYQQQTCSGPIFVALRAQAGKQQCVWQIITHTAIGVIMIKVLFWLLLTLKDDLIQVRLIRKSCFSSCVFCTVWSYWVWIKTV